MSTFGRFRASALVFAALLYFPAVARAQNAGVEAGINVATLKVTPDQPDITSYIGFVGGFFVNSGNDRIGLQTEGLYSRVGHKVKGSTTSFTHLDYFEIPVLLRVRVAQGPHLVVRAVGGPALGLLLSAHANASKEDIKDQLKTYDIGIIAGGNLEIGRITIDGRYMWGVVNIAKAGDKVKTRTVTFMAGVQF